MPVGFQESICFDKTRKSWDGKSARPLSWAAWYPTSEQAPQTELNSPWFVTQPVVRNAAIATFDKPLPLVLLSHGSGASTHALEWLAHRLAKRGFVALAVNHHGHTGEEKEYRAEGFLCLWERARDLSALLSEPSWRQAIGGDISTSANVAGFSAGAYTAMLLMGARVAYSQFEPDNPEKSAIRGPREFPDLVDQLPKLQTNPTFRKSWDARRDDFSDPRFVKASVIAPGRSVLGFDLNSLSKITKPIHIFGGDADTVAPINPCCAFLSENVTSSKLEVIKGGVGHYTFLPEGTNEGLRAAPELFMDEPGVEREFIHDHVADKCVEFFK
ncbi:alpha/beta hydrolase family protein [Maritalea sp.]|uniref:alpha/beta hydrolase family protein n=1 Tax=Maritalea sp. TaxID=2003361 RepID=UPI003EF8E2C9